ncbi:hypothetical protein GCK32_007488, partial [Trichostrongylus colubriformis]
PTRCGYCAISACWSCSAFLEMSSRRDDGGSACVSRSPIPVRATFLRNVYSLLTVQQLIIALVSYTLFMTPGVRPFVQHYGSTTWLTVLALVISIFFLRHTRHSPQFHALAFTVFTIAAALACGGELCYRNFINLEPDRNCIRNRITNSKAKMHNNILSSLLLINPRK